MQAGRQGRHQVGTSSKQQGKTNTTNQPPNQPTPNSQLHQNTHTHTNETPKTQRNSCPCRWPPTCLWRRRAASSSTTRCVFCVCFLGGDCGVWDGWGCVSVSVCGRWCVLGRGRGESVLRRSNFNRIEWIGAGLCDDDALAGRGQPLHPPARPDTPGGNICRCCVWVLWVCVGR